jgi:energy-coupling factor transporter ATP-binding protein EcfA2
MTASARWTRGSEWLRWDPHIHCPGTLFEDQFGGDWSGYLAAIESADPAPSALGITDYFTLRGYKEFLARTAASPLSSVAFVFPNVEMRLTVNTRRGGAINLHLLFSPDDRDHVVKIEASLSRLLCPYNKRQYPCTDAGLIELGRASTRNASLPDENALREGAQQFKAEFSAILGLFDDQWMRDNALIAVAAGQDGLGGVAEDSQWRVRRDELGRNAQIIFSGSPNERAFWLRENPGLPKRPCLHGSDAHRLDRVLRPDGNRLCWIRGDASFESLRQTVMEPERRVFIGGELPREAAEGYVISRFDVDKARWLGNRQLEFNEGLVTIIGAKGSGKTALADLIALVAGADEPNPGSASFIKKARSQLSGLEATINWGDGTQQSDTVEPDPQASPEPRVQYLSQQFVERLSTPESLGEPLIEEIERVVFNAVPDEDRMQTATFSELRDLILEDIYAGREFHQDSIRTHTRTVADEFALKQSIPALTKKVTESERANNLIQSELAAVPTAASAERAKDHAMVSAALTELQAAIAVKDRRAKDLADVRGEVARQLQVAEQEWETLRSEYPTLLDDEIWNALRPRIGADGLSKLQTLESQAKADAAKLRSNGLAAPASGPLTSGGLATLRARLEGINKDLGLDKSNAQKKADLERRLTTARANLDQAGRELVHAQGAAARQKEAWNRRLEEYDAVFDTLREEEGELAHLYAPLLDRIRGSKLGFSVRRVVDLDAWIEQGEGLIDMRHVPFSDRGYLAGRASQHLLEPWASGTAADVRTGMSAFLEEVATPALKALVQDATPVALGKWLFSTDHIRVVYGIEYEGVEIANLSPGTRGVVLLTLYLSLDEWDLRPLIIDQPEENLDPSSVYDELVQFFRKAAKRRQIIMVTHNANLVVNTDSDQVIVATAVRDRPQDLPRITYHAGGLEDPAIRADVCSLLEGGRDAFRRRGMRYGMDIKV